MRVLDRIMDHGASEKRPADAPHHGGSDVLVPDTTASPSKLASTRAVGWGRTNTPQWCNNTGAAFMVAVCPFWMWINWAALEHFNRSLLATFRSLFSPGLRSVDYSHLPRHNHCVALGYMAWVAFQALLYAFLPGRKAQGQQTPGGNVLAYMTNGLFAFGITLFIFVVGSATGLVELNPRLGTSFDIKFFHNGRPGIAAWLLIDLSWAANEFRAHGSVGSSTVITALLHAIYIVDFFLNEDWYLKTIDITHDHFGFMLAWGDTIFLPSFYTLQTQFLARYPTHATTWQNLSILTLGLAGYAIFRSANHQKHIARATNGACNLWGKPATSLRCTYTTSDGTSHETILLTSGWWGLCRHTNYLADLLQAWAMCATCGFTYLLPWSYFFYMLVLLNHRVWRDEARCRAKYGEKWEEYCQKVRWRLIPGVY